jgi:hypothetical protein
VSDVKITRKREKIIDAYLDNDNNKTITAIAKKAGVAPSTV